MATISNFKIIRISSSFFPDYKDTRVILVIAIHYGKPAIC